MPPKRARPSDEGDDEYNDEAAMRDRESDEDFVDEGDDDDEEDVFAKKGGGRAGGAAKRGRRGGKGGPRGTNRSASAG